VPAPAAVGLFTRLLPWGVALLFATYVAGKARPPHVPGDAFDFYEAGKIPVVYQGRVKPLDTLARNSLKIVSWRETYVGEDEKTQPAVRWLFELAMNVEEMEKLKIFWIDAPEVLNFFDLKPRKSHLYSGKELKPHLKEFRKEVAEAHDTAKERLTVVQRRLIELDRRIREIQLLQGTFIPPELGELPSASDLRSDDSEAKQRVAEFREVLVEGPRRLAAVHPPLIVPVKVDPADPFSQMSETKEKFDWQPFSTAWVRSRVKTRLGGGDPDPAAAAWSQIFVSYAKGDAGAFNQAVRDYRALLAKDPPPQLRSADIDFESFFNNFAPFYYSAVLYLCVFLLAALSWLVWTVPLNRAAFLVTLVALAVHSFALVSRMYISGRPPVTNLYATAVFIGWGCVVLCLIFELFHRSGIGTVIAGVTGFATLLISHFLSGDGDTFTVLQAVLDTQFWLATHVVIINLGYAATLLAGMFGVLFILRGFLTPSLSQSVERDLTRMIYGTLCFAIFLSFVGTVLGGLWADDSWGRFWGWDPKENGALLIVLWNALVLHARWGGMVKTKGLAVLAVAGGIVTTWSWFGVNELGVGLHSYGFTAGVLQSLALFDASQIFIIALGCLPRDAWWSYRSRHLAA
jgi:ABC-type transport system involved in cytochrome c biogenesis permease subunit